MPGKLIITIDGKPFGDFDISKSVTTIGRKSDNDIAINYPLASSRHCQIMSVAADWFIEDLNSTNGTCINGKTIKKSGLKNNDIISIGNCEIKFQQDRPAAGADDDDDDGDDATVIFVKDKKPAAGAPSFQNPAQGGFAQNPAQGGFAQNPAQGGFAQGAATREVTKSSATVLPSGPKGKLQILNGANAGKEMELQKQLTTIGKPGSQLAAITRRVQGYFLIHVDGPPDVFPSVNGKSIGSQAAPLNDHDLIEVAGIKMEFFIS